MRVITLDSNKKIISVKNVLDNYVLQSNEIKSDSGEIGQVQQAGSFITPTPTNTIITKPITLEELQTNQLTIMSAIADLYTQISSTSSTATK